MTLLSMMEEVTAETQIPIPTGIEEQMTPIRLRSGLSLTGFTERISTGEIRQKKSIDAAQWDCSERYVSTEGSSMMARVEWTYESEEQTIDSGRMTVVKAITNDLTSVESVEVSET